MIKQNKNSNEDSLKNIKNSVPKMKETKQIGKSNSIFLPKKISHVKFGCLWVKLVWWCVKCSVCVHTKKENIFT